MQFIFFTTLPFFALVLCGYLAAHRRIVPESAIGGLNAFVLFFALPCLLFRFGMNTPVLELLNLSVLAVYLTAAALVVFFTISMTLSRRVGMKDAAFGALVAAFPNTGFMGVPLLVALLGPTAAGPVICTLLADMVITSSVCLALAQTGQSTGQNLMHALMLSLRAAVSNPLPWSIAAGVALGVLQWTLPTTAMAVVNMLADAASPVALFTIGAVLWRSGASLTTPIQPSAHRDQRERAVAMAQRASLGESVLVDPEASTLPSVWLQLSVEGAASTSHDSRSSFFGAPKQWQSRVRAWRERWAAFTAGGVTTVVAIKLLLHPLLILLVGTIARGFGAPLTNSQLTVLALAAALPSASNVSLLVERNGADAGRVARIILGSTVLAVGSFTLIAWSFGAGEP